jgi:hypothetical protein
MRLFLVNFAGLTAIAFFQIHCDAGDAVLKDKIVRATLNHNQPAAGQGRDKRRHLAGVSLQN